MIDLLVVAGLIALTVQAFIGLSFFISCVWEKEKRASVVALLQFAVMMAMLAIFISFAMTNFFHTPMGKSILVFSYVGLISAAILLLRRSGHNSRALKGTNGLIVGEVKQHDEREIVFARNRSLPQGSEQFKIFYKAHPEYIEYDDKRRQMGGPLGQIGTIDNPNADINNAMMFASLNIPMYLGDPSITHPDRHPALKNKLGNEKVQLSANEATIRIKGYAKRIGANLVGITKLNSSWMYSHRGEIFRENWDDWGEKINVDHKYVIVVAEEMDFDLVGAAPHTPTSVESMFNYAKGAFISTQIASFIANLGYSATANHFRHYDGLMVPLAVDAGLGEINRMGYLMTKELGPRVRLSAITTDLTLVPDKPVDIGVEHFCEVCKKCAVCCPSKSIPDGEQREINGSMRWKLNAETCFTYWGKIGTDCNRCMMTCPWSHARTFPHRLIVFLITRNKLARIIFSYMDDLFYGRLPKSKKGPDWTSFK